MSLARRNNKAASRMDRHILFFLSNPSMDLSALQAVAKTLERSLDSLGFWLFAFTALVVVGLIVEYRYEVAEFWEEVRRPAAMFPWHKFWAIAGGIMVTVGVAGELIVGIKSSRKEGALRTINHGIEALLTNQASENDKEAKRLEAVAEQERLARVKLEKEIMPRNLDELAQKKVAGELKQFAKSLSGRKVEVDSYVADAEGIVFSLELKDVLTKAGIVVDPFIGRIMPIGLPDDGILVTGPPADEPFMRTFCNSVYIELSKTTPGFTDITSMWDAKFDRVRVLVGVKPMPGMPRLRTQKITPTKRGN
jgi:hypothetical protein